MENEKCSNESTLCALDCEHVCSEKQNIFLTHTKHAASCQCQNDQIEYAHNKFMSNMQK
jgi:hypothetical protein